MGPWTTVVSAAELLRAIDDPDLRVVDVRHKLVDPAWGRGEYAKGHLPGAVFAHIDDDLSSRITSSTGRHPLPAPEAFRAFCSKIGIDERTQVVVYDDQGGIWAARLWWLLQDYGHRAVALLDGGIQAWTDAGGRLTSVAPSVRLTSFHGSPGHRPTVDAAAIQRLGPRLVLLDARAAERFRGDVEPIDPVAGHIPGATSLPAVSLLRDGTRLIPTNELRDLLAPHAASGTTTAAYCGSGVTACATVLAFEAAGLGPIALYPGSWSEWIRDAKRPVARGPR